MIIFRYLFKEVYGTLLASTVVLLLLLTSNQFVHYLTLAATGAVPIRTVLLMMSLQVPLLLPLLLPLGLYLGILMAYGRLYVDNEMTVLSACGLSKMQLTGMTLIYASLISIVIALFTVWIQPKSEGYKRQALIDAATSSPLDRISPGNFISIDKAGLIFYAHSLSRDHKDLQNVFVAQKPDSKHEKDQAWTIVVANNGHQMLDSKTHDKFLVLENGHRYTGNPGEANFQITKFATYGVRIEQNALPPDQRVEAMPTMTLWQQRHSNPQFEAELQWRISLPLSALILALLAIPLSKVNPRQGRYAQLFPAFLLYILYVDLLFVARAWLDKDKISPYLGMWWVHALILLITSLLFIRFITWSKILFWKKV